MGWFSKKKEKKTDKTNKAEGVFKEAGMSKSYKECPVCGRQTFFACTHATGIPGVSASALVPVANIVGEKTGVCTQCGAMCNGEIYLTGMDEPTLIEHALWNNQAAKNLFDFMAKQNPTEETLNKALKQVENVDPDMYKRGNFWNFFVLCSRHINSQAR